MVSAATSQQVEEAEGSYWRVEFNGLVQGSAHCGKSQLSLQRDTSRFLSM